MPNLRKSERILGKVFAVGEMDLAEHALSEHVSSRYP